MPKLITWNIESARTADGGADLDRVVSTLTRFSHFDVLCLQEVACGYEARDGSPLGDQFTGLALRLPGYNLACCTALDTLAPDGSRRRLDSMILTRYRILQVLRHSLPWPADPDAMSMPRCALEVTLQTPAGLLRVLSVQLESFSSVARMAQVERLRDLQREAVQQARVLRPGGPEHGVFEALPRAADAVLLGDFGMLPDSPEYTRLLASFADGTPPLRDAWQLAQPGRRHAPTVGLHDDRPDAAAPFAFDFAFVSNGLAERVGRMRVDAAETGSDHQALLLELG